MKLLVMVLNKVELLDKLLITLSNEDIRGATIISTTGMASELANSEDTNILGSLRMLLGQSRSDNRTIFIVLPDEKVQRTLDIIHKIVGDLSEPQTGILFTVPLDYTEGIR